MIGFSRTMRRLMAILMSIPLMGCAHYGVPMHELAQEVNSSLYAGPYLLQPGDFITVSFQKVPRYNTQARVRLDGKISMPLIGEVSVAGKDTATLTKELVTAYAVAPERPEELTVNVGFAFIGGAGGGGGAGGIGGAGGDAVTVTGELNGPGLVTLNGNRITLVEAIGRAGGHLTPTALLANTLLIRRSPVTGLQQSWRIDARHRHWGKGDPIYLQPMDLVFVPNTPVDDVNNWVQEYINQNIPAGGILGLVIGLAVAN